MISYMLMNNLFSMSTSQIKNIYGSLNMHKHKDKMNMILEPLQAMIQLALLKVVPIGTKLSISENILYLQIPSLVQPLSRWYNCDKKDDLFFLFQVIKRFIKWYHPNNLSSPINKEMYDLLISMVNVGLDKLIDTYKTTESLSIIQVIQMYKSILISGCDSSESDGEKSNMDDVFEEIIKTYDKDIINIIYNSLLIINKETNVDVINNYINGLNLLMSKNNDAIKTWIRTKLSV